MGAARTKTRPWPRMSRLTAPSRTRTRWWQQTTSRLTAGRETRTKRWPRTTSRLTAGERTRTRPCPRRTSRPTGGVPTRTRLWSRTSRLTGAARTRTRQLPTTTSLHTAGSATRTRASQTTRSTRRPRERARASYAPEVSQGAYSLNLGLVPYREAWELQRSLAGAASQGAIPDTVVFLEHPAVVTLGRRAEEGELHIPPGADVELVETDRGGKSTYHGPGQLVCYPILD